MLSQRASTGTPDTFSTLLTQSALITLRLLIQDYPQFKDLWKQLAVAINKSSQESVRPAQGAEAQTDQLLDKITAIIEEYNTNNRVVRTNHDSPFDALSPAIGNLSFDLAIDRSTQQTWIALFQAVSKRVLGAPSENDAYLLKPIRNIDTGKVWAGVGLPTGQVVTTSEELQHLQVLKFWQKDANGQYQLLQQLPTAHRFEIVGFFVLANGDLVTSSQEGCTILWRRDLNGDYRYHQTLDGHTAIVKSLLSNSADELVTASFDGTIKIWREQNGYYQCLQTLTGHEEYISKIMKLPSGDLVSASGDPKIIIWRKMADGNYHQLQSITDDYPVRSLLALAAGGKFLSLTAQGLKIWRLDANEQYSCQQIIYGTYAEGVLALLPNGDFVTAKNNILEVWHEAANKTYQLLQTVNEFNDRVVAVAISAAGTIFATSRAALKVLQSDAAGVYQCRATIDVNNGSLFFLHSDNELVSSTATRELTVWCFPVLAERIAEEQQAPLSIAQALLREYLQEAERAQEPARLFGNYFQNQTAQIRQLLAKETSWRAIAKGLANIEDPSRAVTILRANVDAIVPANAEDLEVYCTRMADFEARTLTTPQNR